MYRLSKLNKFKVGIGDTKIIQFHHSSLKEFLRKFLWYGKGDAEFVKKYPHKIFSILFHQIIRYPLIYPLKAILKFKFRSVVYFISMGLIRFWALSTYVFKK